MWWKVTWRRAATRTYWFLYASILYMLADLSYVRRKCHWERWLRHVLFESIQNYRCRFVFYSNKKTNLFSLALFWLLAPNHRQWNRFHVVGNPFWDNLYWFPYDLSVSISLKFILICWPFNPFKQRNINFSTPYDNRDWMEWLRPIHQNRMV